MPSNRIENPIRLQRIEYWINWLSSGFATGKWNSYFRGRGFEFRGVAPFDDDPDLIRINWPATIDTGELMVSQFFEERNINLYLLANLGPSMAFGSEMTKMDRLATLAAITSYSAFRIKDYFRFIGYTDELEFDFPEPRDNTYPILLAQAIMDFDWHGKKRGGLVKAASALPSRRSLVIIISDFLGSINGLERALTILSPNHEVLPLILWDQREVELPGQGFGLFPFRDIETNELSYIFLTKKTRERFAENSRLHRQALENLFRYFGIEPHFMISQESNEDIEKLMRIFLAQRNRV